MTNSVKTLAAFFVVKVKAWDSHNYPYWQDVSAWEDHIQAFESGVGDKNQIVLRHVNVHQDGRIRHDDSRVVWEAGKWVSSDHDPRMADPQFREYLRLRNLFEKEEE